MRDYRILGIVGAALVAVVASPGGGHAQQYLDCRSNGGNRVTCANPNAGLQQTMDAAERARQQAAAGARRGPSTIEILQGLSKSSRRKKVGKLVAAGKCDEATQVVLKAGDFDLAQDVRQACAPAPGPAAQN